MLGNTASEPAAVTLARDALSRARGAGFGGFCPICRTRGCAHQEKLETETRCERLKYVT